MEFLELAQTRHSVRHFAGRPIAPADLRQVLAAMKAAPSAGDLQAYEVVEVHEPAVCQRLSEAAQQSFLCEAATLLVFFADPVRSAPEYGDRGASLYALQDATIAAAYAQLAAHARGLGAVWVGAFDEAAVRRALGAPQDVIPVAMLAIGHPAEKPAATPRRSLEELVFHESWARH